MMGDGVVVVLLNMNLMLKWFVSLLSVMSWIVCG